MTKKNIYIYIYIEQIKSTIVFTHLLRLCLVRVKAFPENIPFSEKENIFMYLVAFQKIFWKIFSGVWRRRRKRQTQTNPEEGEDGVISIFARSRLMAQLSNERARRSHHSLIVAIDCDRRAHSLDDRTAHRSRCSSIDEHDRRSVLSDLGSLFSLLSLSLSLRK